MTTEPRDTGAGDLVDMFDEELMRDPFGGYSRIREQPRLVRGVLRPVDPVWLVTRHDEVTKVLSDPRFVTNPETVPGLEGSTLRERVLREGETPAEYLAYRVSRLGQHEGAGHARLRAAVSGAFGASRVAALRPRIEELAAGLLERLPAAAEDGVVDLYADFAFPLPSTVLCEVIGVPAPDHVRWRDWCIEVKRPHLALREKAEVWRDLVTYARELIGRARAGGGPAGSSDGSSDGSPGNDLVSVMTRARGISDTEIIAMMLLEHNAHQDTAHLIVNGTVALLAHPAQLDLLRESPDLLPRAVDELLRFCGPVPVARLRHAVDDVEIRGTVLRRGEGVWPVLAGADYDPRVFDLPERLDITRGADGHRDEPDGWDGTGARPHPHRRPHVAFGAGAHRCVGAGLACAIAEVAIGELVRRFPGLAPAADPAELHRLKPRQWGLVGLPVRLA